MLWTADRNIVHNLVVVVNARWLSKVSPLLSIRVAIKVMIEVDKFG
jgi:hypothetical protein